MDDLTPVPDHSEQHWMLQARCRALSPGEFFPSDGVGVEIARRACEGCPVKAQCLEYAITAREKIGVWGGYTARERRRLVRQRRRTA